MASSIAGDMGLEIVILEYRLEVTTIVGTYSTYLRKIPLFDVVIYGRCFPTSFILLNIEDFDLILGFDWLGYYYALLYFFKVGFLFNPMGKPEFYFPCRQGVTEGVLVSTH